MKQILLRITALLLVLALAGCAAPAEVPVSTEIPETTAPVVPDETADNYRVFYEIFVGSFADSNGDRKGDIPGILQKLDYLNDGNVLSETSLGVQGLWLTPIFASPSYHKYDVTDYYRIDPDFGTQEDLKALVDACHERNVKVILDLVLTPSANVDHFDGGKIEGGIDAVTGATASFTTIAMAVQDAVKKATEE